MSIFLKPILQNQTFLKSLLNRSRPLMTSSTETREKPLVVVKELPLEMVSFVKLLYKQGYLKNANFLRGGEEFDVKRLDQEFARTFVKFAAEKFGRDHQEIAKLVRAFIEKFGCKNYEMLQMDSFVDGRVLVWWLYGSDLKKIVLFGCPSLEKRAIFAAKTLRNFFDIQENNVCDKCVLKDKCKYRNKSVWDGRKTKNLDLSVVMKVITLYPLDLTHQNLQVPRQVQDLVLRLLTEIQNLSRTISTPFT